MSHLTRNDYATVLALVARLEQLAPDAHAFEAAVLQALGGFVAAEHAWIAHGPDGMDRAGPGFTATVPLATEGGRPVCIALRRQHRDFGPRDRERLALLQPHLAYLYRQAHRPAPAAAAAFVVTPSPLAWPVRPAGTTLTRREGDVMQWLACGKTDADIAVLLAISPRTVHKHLEHIYEKLGVETRTAAVMALGRRAQRATV